MWIKYIDVKWWREFVGELVRVFISYKTMACVGPSVSRLQLDHMVSLRVFNIMSVKVGQLSN